MQLELNRKYILKNGEVISFRRNSLPHYKFSAEVNKDHYLFNEVWTENGVAYHNDCGFSVLAEQHQLNTTGKQ